METNRVYCKKCTHYFITWDTNFPNGCRFFGIKSSAMPSQTVYQSTGELCPMYQQKNKEKESK